MIAVFKREAVNALREPLAVKLSACGIMDATALKSLRCGLKMSGVRNIEGLAYRAEAHRLLVSVGADVFYAVEMRVLSEAERLALDELNN